MLYNDVVYVIEVIHLLLRPENAGIVSCMYIQFNTGIHCTRFNI